MHSADAGARRGRNTNYTYDDAGQLTSEGVVAQTYDANGNLLTRGADTFTWDYADRLTEATASGETTSFEYDADGVRVEKTAGTETTEFLWDRESGLPLLVDDGEDSYLHFDGLLAEVDDQGDATYLLDDGLGSIRGLTDEAGSLAGSASYDVFGGSRASTGASSAFGFSGEQWDSETGFGFLRARYLIPGLGRFLSGDRIQPNAPGTQGFNLYAYVANNPTTWVDPSGLGVIVAHPMAIAIYLIILYVAWVLSQAMEDLNWDGLGDKLRDDLGSGGLGGVFEGGLEELLDAAEELPLVPDLVGSGATKRIQENEEDTTENVGSGTSARARTRRDDAHPWCDAYSEGWSPYPGHASIMAGLRCFGRPPLWVSCETQLVQVGFVVDFTFEGPKSGRLFNNNHAGCSSAAPISVQPGTWRVVTFGQWRARNGQTLDTVTSSDDFIVAEPR